MVAVRIPGAESIDPVAPARDPGVTASPEDFGANIGASATHFGDALSSLGAHLEIKRQGAEDQTYKNSYDVNVAPRLARADIETKQKYPNGGAEYEEAADTAYLNAHASTKADLAAKGIKASDGALRAVDTSFAGRFANLRVGAVTYNNNSQVKKLQDQTDTNFKTTASQVLSGDMDVDTAIAQVDATVDGARSLYPGGQLPAIKKAAREQVYDAAIENAIAAKDPAKADELRARFYGGTPKPGQEKADALTQRESSGNPTLVNQLGYAGLHQFGAPRLETLGVYKPGPNENLKTWSTTAKDAPGKWSGTFNIEGFPEVKTLKDYLANPEAQKAVYANHVGAMDEESTAQGLDKYIGQTVGGVEITRSGIRNMSHLGGSGGAAKFLKSDGEYNPADANGTKLSDYAKMGAKSGDAESPNLAKSLAFKNRIDSLDGVNRAEVGDAIKDDLASVQANGFGDSTLTADRITKALGPNAAADWQTARARAKDFHTQTQDFSTLPADQMNLRIAALAAKPGQDEYIAQDALHTAAIKKADAIMKTRKEDPAESVSDDPEVKRAITNFDPKDPTTTQAIIRARIAAQTRAGIMAPAPLPREETQLLLKPIAEAVKLEDYDRTPKGKPNRIVLAQKQLVDDLKTKYGAYADDVMREVVGEAANQRDRNDLADAAGKVMSALINGTIPGDKPKTQTKVGAENNAATKAMSIGSIVDGMGTDSATFSSPAPPPKTPSAKSIQILRSAPAADQARLSALFDKQFNSPGLAAKILNEKTAPTGTVTVDDNGESYTP